MTVTITDIEKCESQQTLRLVGETIKRKAKSKNKRKTKDRLERPKAPETNISENIVGWDGQMDTNLPLNFSKSLKWRITLFTSGMNLMVAFASSMIAPGISYVSAEFHNTSSTLETFTVTVFLLGLTVGPLIFSPLSELYGRKVVLTWGNVIFILLQIACALAPNLNALICFRFLGAMGGSATFTIGAASISDLFDIDERGTASSIYALGTLFGPVVGPVCGAFIAKYIGWRWSFWSLSILSTILALAILFLGKETNHEVLIRWKVEKFRKELSNPNLRSCYVKPGSQPISSSQLMLTHMTTPFRLLFFSPIILLLSIYGAFVYGMQYIFSTTIPSVFMTTYQWDPEYTGLAYLGLGLGFLVGALTVARINDATTVRMALANNGVAEPEMRLPACVLFACLIPVSFFWYGWSTFYKVHWSVPIIGLIPFGIGQIGVFVPIQAYILDSFPTLAASSFAAVAVVRCLLGAILPLAGPSMYQSLGLGWGNTIFGLIAIALIPFPLLIFKYGGLIRKKYPVKI
jgi:multidrug resistance protein